MNLVPLPRQFTATTGTVSFKKGWALDAPDDLAKLECLADLKFLKRGARGPLRLRVDPELEGCETDEDYRLALDPGLIELTGRTRTGVIRGIQTLRQLARAGECEAGVIDDCPTLELRGMHLDLKTQMHNFDYILRIVDRLAELKYNTLLIEWEDKFPYSRRPEVVHPDALNREQVAKLKAHCAKYAIEIIPLVQTFAHLEFALSLDRYASLRETADYSGEICPMKPEAMELVRDLVRDIVAGHPESRYIHLGADESWRMGTCPQCRANVEREGKSAHFIDHVLKVIPLVLEAGKTPIIWADMLASHPEAISSLPREVVLLDWQYHNFGVYAEQMHAWGEVEPITAESAARASDTFKSEYAKFVVGRHPSDPRLVRSFPYVEYFKEKGFEVITGPAIRCWPDPSTNPNHFTHVPNIWGFAATAAIDGALGTVLTSWAVRRCPWPTTWYGIALGAETMWNPNEGVRDDFDARFMMSQYLVGDASFPKVFAWLDRPREEDRFDHCAPTYDSKQRRWKEKDVAEALAEKDKAGLLAESAAPMTAAKEAFDRSHKAVEAFRGLFGEAQ